MVFLKLVVLEVIKAGVPFHFWRHSSGKLEWSFFKGSPLIRTFRSLNFIQCLWFCFEHSCGEKYPDVCTHPLAPELRVALNEQNLQGQLPWDFALFLYRILCLYLCLWLWEGTAFMQFHTSKQGVWQSLFFASVWPFKKWLKMNDPRGRFYSLSFYIFNVNWPIPIWMKSYS